MNKNFDIEEFIKEAKEVMKKPASEDFTPFTRESKLFDWSPLPLRPCPFDDIGMFNHEATSTHIQLENIICLPCIK